MYMQNEHAEHSNLVDHDLVKHWKNLKNRPQIIVFDLDYTLWPFYASSLSPRNNKQHNYVNHEHPYRFHVDSNASSTISKIRNKKKNKAKHKIVIDTNMQDIEHYRDVSRILHTLKHHCFEDTQHLAVASRSTTRRW